MMLLKKKKKLNKKHQLKLKKLLKKTDSVDTIKQKYGL